MALTTRKDATTPATTHLYVALELSKDTWKLGFTTSRAGKIRIRTFLRVTTAGSWPRWKRRSATSASATTSASSVATRQVATASGSTVSLKRTGSEPGRGSGER